MTISLEQFYLDVYERVKRTNERNGQAMFNHLYEVRPDLSEQVRATDKDPFYLMPSDPRFRAFISFIEENWEKK